MVIIEKRMGPGPLLWRRRRPCSVPPTAPHLQLGADARTTMTVSWSTFGPVRNPVLELAGGDAVAADSRAVRGTPTVYHHAVVSGLRPGSIHQYRLAHDGAAGRPRTLRTADDLPAPFTFTAFGDQGVSDSALVLSALVRRISPAFHLHAGDLSYADPHGLGTPGTLHPERWDLWLAMISASLAEQAPWMPVVGNHEIEAGAGRNGYGGFLARFALPGNGAPGAPTTWWSRYGNLAVVGLDSNDASCEVTVNAGYTNGAQDRWLDDRLAALRADPGIDWVVVVFHHCAYSTNSLHASDGGVRRWTPLFDRHDVDLVVNGHNHCYERTHPLRRGVVTTPLTAGADVDGAGGTVYVTAGAGGGDGHDRWVDDGSYVRLPNGERRNEAAPWSATRETGASLLAVDVDPGGARGTANPSRTTLRLRAVRADGSEIERVTLSRRSSPEVHRAARQRRPAATSSARTCSRGRGS